MRMSLDEVTLTETETTERIENAAKIAAGRAVMKRDAVGIARTLFSHDVQFAMDVAKDWIKFEIDNPTDGAGMEAALLVGANPILGEWTYSILNSGVVEANKLFYTVRLTAGVK